MDTRQLAAFCAVVERESFSQAAARLGVTQPAVSQQIRALENRVGRQLLDRSGRRVVPTEAGMRLYHARLGREVRVGDAITFMAADRQHADEAYAGDIIGLHNHGTINIGDTFTQGERLSFTGVPDFAPEIFRRANAVLETHRDRVCRKDRVELLGGFGGRGRFQAAENDVAIGECRCVCFESNRRDLRARSVDVDELETGAPA